MGAKGSKPESPGKPATPVAAPPVAQVPAYRGVNADDTEMFPPEVIAEFKRTLQSAKPDVPYVFGVFPHTSALMQWIYSAPSYFNNSGRGSTVLPKDYFLSDLIDMCNEMSLRDVYIANVLETATDIVLAFSNTGEILGFVLLGRDLDCLHGYLICSGPRYAGLGSKLMQVVVTYAKQLGIKCIRIGASHAEEFHKKQGFIETGKQTLEGKEMIYRIPSGGRRKTKKSKRKTRRVRK